MPPKRLVNSKKLAAARIKKLRARVRELEETFAAIQGGLIDAVVVNTPKGENVFTLHGAEHPYRVLVENMNEGAATMDPDGIVLYANASFAKILGVSLERVIGAPLLSHVSIRERARLRALIQAAMRSQVKGELKLEASAGQERLVRLSFSPVNDFGVQTVSVVATDLTELSGANDALKATEERLRNLSGRLLRLQDEERRRISRDLHDITGQKLALLSMDLSQIESGEKPLRHPDMKHVVAEAVTLAKECNHEIRTLSYVLHPPLLDELGLACAVEWFTQGFESRTGIGVQVDIPSDLVRLSPDAEVAMFRVVQESLTNVHRYSESPTAFVRARAEGGEVILEIGDAGKGMSEAQLQSRDSVATLGVGIQGMRERIRQLSGKLEINSRPGNGTKIIATLPIGNRETEISEGNSGAGGAEARASRNGDESKNGGPRKRILIADDHEVFRRGIRTMLEAENGLEICCEAVDGKDAVEKTLAHAPDLVILDLNMPVINGLEVCRQILRHSPKTKVLVLSVDDSEKIAQEVFVAGAQSYLSKSAAAEKLLHEVIALLSERSQVQNA